jgi:hypothetical protein
MEFAQAAVKHGQKLNAPAQVMAAVNSGLIMKIGITMKMPRPSKNTSLTEFRLQIANRHRSISYLVPIP